ncbi:hypothetical protein VTK73DRAFT_1702 [Phialemonium thermophilum]|uniref:Mid2 domain-containing protein n=1 Tax=Phialemonium thermophilum TaxID=223376 RepID=A0ABR3X7X8_9PEZI
MRPDLFLRPPPSTAWLLLLSTILDPTSAHAVYERRSRQPTLPLATKTAHPLAVVSFPSEPTPAPSSPLELRHRRAHIPPIARNFNTICGYIGGDPELPATCSPGSHCVLDEAHGAVGCCPDDESPCTTGVFTGCVDANSPPQTAADPYVFTCTGGEVCYRNVFAGGFFQFGCGTASNLATTVLATATGVTATLDRPSVSVDFVQSPAAVGSPSGATEVTLTRSNPTGRTTAHTGDGSLTVAASRSTSGVGASRTVSVSGGSSATGGSTDSTSRSSSSSSRTSGPTSSFTTSASSIPTQSSSSSSTAAQTTATSSSTAAAPPVNKALPTNRTGAIIGGTISGVAVLIALVAGGIYLWRRHQRKREMLRDGPTEYISPMTGGGSPIGGGGGGGAFQPLHQSPEGWETGLAPTAAGALELDPDSTDAGHRYPGYLGRQPTRPPRPPGPGYQPVVPADAVLSTSPRYGPDSFGDPAGPMAATGLGGRYGNEAAAAQADTVPLTREIDDFSRGFHDALERIGEEDETTNSSGAEGSGGNGRGVNTGTIGLPGPRGRGLRPLWQQNRRQSRNLMWM